MKDFIHNFLKYLKELTVYLDQVQKEDVTAFQYDLICESEEFQNFHDLFIKTKHTGLSKKESEELMTSIIDKIKTSYNVRIDEVSKMIKLKMSDIHMDILKNV